MSVWTICPEVPTIKPSDLTCDSLVASMATNERPSIPPSITSTKTTRASTPLQSIWFFCFSDRTSVTMLRTLCARGHAALRELTWRRASGCARRCAAGERGGVAGALMDVEGAVVVFVVLPHSHCYLVIADDFGRCPLKSAADLGHQRDLPRDKALSMPVRRRRDGQRMRAGVERECRAFGLRRWRCG